MEWWSDAVLAKGASQHSKTPSLQFCRSFGLFLIIRMLTIAPYWAIKNYE